LTAVLAILRAVAALSKMTSLASVAVIPTRAASPIAVGVGRRDHAHPGHPDELGELPARHRHPDSLRPAANDFPCPG
jgi:hypothetical protein